MSEIRDKLSKSFDLASLRNAASKRLTGEDWRQFQDIKEAHAQQRSLIEKTYAQNDPALMAKAKDHVLREYQRNPPTLELRPPVGAPLRGPMTNAELDHRARRRVDAAKEADLAQVDQNETRMLDALIDNRSAREAFRENATQDQPRGPDRRRR